MYSTVPFYTLLNCIFCPVLYCGMQAYYCDKNATVLKAFNLCDGSQECADGADESSTTCDTDFRCSDSGRVSLRPPVYPWCTPGAPLVHPTCAADVSCSDSGRISIEGGVLYSGRRVTALCCTVLCFATVLLGLYPLPFPSLLLFPSHHPVPSPLFPSLTLSPLLLLSLPRSWSALRLGETAAPSAASTQKKAATGSTSAREPRKSRRNTAKTLTAHSPAGYASGASGVRE